jgi:hypothetical protein
MMRNQQSILSLLILLAERCEHRRMEEAKRAVEILKQREVLGKQEP